MAFKSTAPKPRAGLKRGAGEYQTARFFDADYQGYNANGIYADVDGTAIEAIKAYVDGTLMDYTDNTGAFKKDDAAVVVADTNIADSATVTFTVRFATSVSCRIRVPFVKNNSVEDLANLIATWKFKTEAGVLLDNASISYPKTITIEAPAA